MSESEDARAAGTWRKGEFVRWQDLLVPIEAVLVWFGLFTLAFAIATAINNRLGHPKADIVRFATNLSKDFDATQIATASLEIVVLFFTWRIARRVAGPSLVARYAPIGRDAFLVAFLGGVVLAALAIFAIGELATHSLVKFHISASERAMFPQSPARLPLSLLCVAVIAPLAEEFYFRGLLLSWLRRKMAAPLAALLSAAIFAFVHFRFVSHPGADGWVYTGTIALVGLVNAVLALRTRSLWGPFAVHAGYNATLISAAVLASTRF
jgi:membrane protease YdiL (CAAX protease family)